MFDFEEMVLISYCHRDSKENLIRDLKIYGEQTEDKDIKKLALNTIKKVVTMTNQEVIALECNGLID